MVYCNSSYQRSPPIKHISFSHGTPQRHMIDTHCHIDIEAFADNFDDIVNKARSAGIRAMVVPGVDRAGWDRLLFLCQNCSELFSAPGLHPLYIANHRPWHINELEALAQKGKISAIGEIGLDYFIESADRTAQQHLFEQQLNIAKINQLPILLHVRKAHDQVLATLRRKHFPYGGIVHAFSGSYQQAMQYIKLDFCIGVGGTITYSRAKRVRRIIKELPPRSLVLETDAPDIPPAGHIGKCNLPEYLPEIVESLAALRGETEEAVTSYTTSNAKRVLGLP